MLHTHRTLLVAAALAALTGCAAELELGETTLESVCIGVEEVPFDGAGLARAAIAIDELDREPLAPEASARLGFIALAAMPGAVLPAIDGVRLELRGRGGLADLLLVDERVPNADSVRVDATGDDDLVPYLDAPPLVFEIAVTGALPRAGFAAGVEVCFELSGVVIEP